MVAFALKSVRLCLIATTLLPLAFAQTFDAKSVSASLDSFSLNFLAYTSHLAGRSLNLALSPYTIWTLMTIVHEGAHNNTARQIEQVMGIPSSCAACMNEFRKSYQNLAKHLSTQSEGVTLDLSNAIFANDDDSTLNATFREVVRNVYGVNVMTADFRNANKAAALINKYLSEVTRRRINNFIVPGDLVDAEIFMASTLYFKGFWKVPFNKTATRRKEFNDESGNFLGEVDMMYQASPFPFSVILDSKALAVELAYGTGDRMSMVVILPKRGETLAEVLRLLAATPISSILDALAKSAQLYSGEDVKVYLPKFRIQSDLVLNAVLDAMGIKDTFNSEKADFQGISDRPLYVSRLVQRAVIDVDEEGTVASAIAGASFNNKSPPPAFVANKPFAYLIVDKVSQAILFVGTVSNPKEI